MSDYRTAHPDRKIVVAARPGECAGCGGPIDTDEEIELAPYRKWSHATDACHEKVVARFMPTRRRTAPEYQVACPDCGAEVDAYCVTESGKICSVHPARKEAAGTA